MGAVNLVMLGLDEGVLPLPQAPRQTTAAAVGPSIAPERRPASARMAWTVLAALSALIALHAAGIVGPIAYPIVTAGGVISTSIGLRIHNPDLLWPWRSIMCSGILWTGAGIVREVTHATGDFTTGRSLLPDLLALPGYASFGIGLFGMLRARRPLHERGALLDGIMVGSGALLLVYDLIVAPTMNIEGTWFMARVAVAIYPAISMCLLVLAARLAFGAGERSPAFTLLVIGTANLVVGDVVFAIGEVHEGFAPQALLEVPYLLVPALLATAAMHPSVRLIGGRTAHPQPRLGRARLAAVAGALLAPIVLIARRDLSDGYMIATVLCTVLGGTAITRLGSAMREQAASEARLAHQATHDELTGLPSRTLLLEHTDRLLAESRVTGQPVAAMFLDLDQFKLVNDSMGHGTGDQLLVVAAQRVRSCLRSDDVVGRISGDEFVVIAGGLDAHGAIALAERIRGVLGEAFDLDAGEVFISTSIGVTIAAPDSFTYAAQMIQEADTAMYRSKDAGRNTVTLFDASMRERVARRVELERRLRHALHERDFTAYYQPIVSLPSGNVMGFEALARWKDEGQMISPAEFIPVAEESGLIVPLGTFMLNSACRQLAMWRRTIPNGQRLTMSVNLSPRQVRESDIVDTVAEALERYDLPGDSLWLEITENVMMEDSISTAAVMTGLRALGVRLTVDDFGTGFSSLSYLKRFPVSRVKIDRSFVSGLGEHQSDSSLVAAIIAMASALDLEPVAEGVETVEQAKRLDELGCHQAQGYLFGRAVPADAVPRSLARLGVISPHRAAMRRRCATPQGRTSQG